ncbi:MAG: epoxyqueuosine reductase QueH [Paludibacteraceae bacterium]|nr:epoxyqueuosine reductase QueH [Paludibacteraceae bacterium]
MNQISPPIATSSVLLHTCCAPCSSAIVEALLKSGIRPTLYFYNPNIYPDEEYMRRKAEVIRYASVMGIDYIDADYNHEQWLCSIQGREHDPERGGRCLECFRMRLLQTASYAHTHGYRVFATTLSTSRWKSLQQINVAGEEAATHYNELCFWGANWRKGGLQERRNELIKQHGFYNQTYCGCEFSMSSEIDSK